MRLVPRQANVAWSWVLLWALLEQCADACLRYHKASLTNSQWWPGRLRPNQKSVIRIWISNLGFRIQIRDLEVQIPDVVFQIPDLYANSRIWMAKSGISDSKSGIWTSKSRIWESVSRIWGPNPGLISKSGIWKLRSGLRGSNPRFGGPNPDVGFQIRDLKFQIWISGC